MAKKKMGKMHGIHIAPKAGTHYEVRHEPKMEPGENGSMPMMGDSEDNTKLFSHGERGELHKHLDRLMDAHEGKGGDTEGGESEHAMPHNHPLHNLKRKAM